MHMKRSITKALAVLLAIGLAALPVSADPGQGLGGSIQGLNAAALFSRASQWKNPYWGRITPKGKVYLKENQKPDGDPGAYEENKSLPLISLSETAEMWLYDYTCREGEIPYPVEYRIANGAEKETIYQALLAVNGVCTTQGYSIQDPDLCTGIDRTTYTPAVTIELRRADGTPGSIVSLYDESYLLYTNGKTGDFNDAFYQGANLPQLFALLDQAMDGRNLVSPTQMLFNQEKGDCYIYSDNQKMYVDVKEASERLQKAFWKAVDSLVPQHGTAADLGKKSTNISSISFYGDGDAVTSMAFYQFGGPIISQLDDYGLVPAEYYTFGDGEFQALQAAAKQAFSWTPKHPYWLGRLVNRDFVSVNQTRSITGERLEETEQAKARWQQVRELLKTAEVDQYQSSSHETILKDESLTFELVDQRSYLIQISENRMKITAESLDYAAEYRLKNGKELLPLLKEALR